MYFDSDLNKIKELILSNIPNAEDIILFGSYANGTANPKSDIDLAVLIDSEIERNEKLKLLAKIRRIFAHQGYNVDVLLKEKSIYLNEISLPTLARAIQTAGRYIWSKA
jgi:predicted nucleotidyltransferase